MNRGFLRQYREQNYAEKFEKIEVSKLTLCWQCKNATNPPPHICPWASMLIPVKGWTAKKKYCNGEETYKVIECPLFQKG